MSDPNPPPQPNPGDPVPQPDPNNPEPMPVESPKNIIKHPCYKIIFFFVKTR